MYKFRWCPGSNTTYEYLISPTFWIIQLINLAMQLLCTENKLFTVYLGKPDYISKSWRISFGLMEHSQERKRKEKKSIVCFW